MGFPLGQVAIRFFMPSVLKRSVGARPTNVEEAYESRGYFPPQPEPRVTFRHALLHIPAFSASFLVKLLPRSSILV